MKSIKHNGASNEFVRTGDIIGWVWEARDKSGYYASYGTKKPGVSVMAAKYPTRSQAESSLRRIQDRVPENTMVARQ